MTQAVPTGTDVRRFSPEVTWRLRYLGVCAVLTGLAFNSASGRTVPDTKLDLVIDPVRFLSRTFHLWDPIGSGGQLQEQAYGYLFPMGPFFALGHLAHIPPWAIQRLWWSLVLCTAFLGVVVLAGRLGMGTPVTRLVGGLVFALSPHVLTVLGPVSAEAWPMALSAWVLVPLVGGSSRGSPRRAAMLSGVAVLLMGGINAALDLTALLPAVLWLLTRRPGPRTWRLGGWWSLSVLLACSWWLVPLLLLGRYSPPFLGYIESAATTTRVTSLTESLRGTADWVPYLSTTGWRAGWILLTQPAVILNTVVLVAFGLAALTLRRTPHRAWLVVMLLVGITCMAAGHVASVDGFAPEQVRAALDGLLAPLRNVHKFDVLIRLPLALGVVALLDRAAIGRNATERSANKVTAVALVVVAVLGACAPLLSLQLAPGGSFRDVPPYWQDAANWLNDHDAQGRALLLPSSRFGQYLWGSTGDEPLQALATSPWEVRSAVPLVPAGHIMMLDAVEQRLAAGQPSSGLASYLAGAGIRYLVVRNDLDYSSTGSPRPLLVQQALAGSPGLRVERVFGPPVGGVGDANLVIDQDLQLFNPAIQIWSVEANGTDSPADARVAAEPAASVPVVNGGPSAALNLADATLEPSHATALVSDEPLPTGLGPLVLSDTLRRRETNFGGAAGVSSSATLSKDDPRRLANAERDYRLPGGDADLATARLTGLAGLDASTSASDPQSFLDTDQAAMPFSAVDRDPATAWRSSPGAFGVGQWLQLRFIRPMNVSGSSLTLPPGGPITQVSVQTDQGSRLTALDPLAATRLETPPGPTRALRVTVTGLKAGLAGFQQVGIAELAVPGVTVGRTIVLPPVARGAGAPSVIQLGAATGARPGCLLVSTRVLCAHGLSRQGEDIAGLDRTFATTTDATYSVGAWATPRPGPELDTLIARAVSSPIRATASSSAVADPLGGPAATVDGDFGTGWVADPADPHPTLTLHWVGLRRVSSVRLISDQYLAATRPDAVQVTVDGEAVNAAVDADGTVRFPAVRTDRLALSFSASRLVPTYDPTTHTPTSLGIGVSEALVPGIVATTRQVSDEVKVALPCGSTPTVTVDGREVPTHADVTVGQLRDTATFPLSVCGSDQIDLVAGPHRLANPSNPTFAAARVLLTEALGARLGPPVATEQVSVQPVSWGATNRAVQVSARAVSTVLLVRENANPGWRATIAGKPLRAFTIDGWQQGYLMPPGSAATVQLTFGPDRWYRWGLAVGLLLAMLLIAGAAWPARQPAHRLAAAVALSGRAYLPAVGVTALALIGGWWGLAAALLWPAVALLLSRGPQAGGTWPKRLRAAPAAVAAGAYLISGAAVAWRHWAGPDYLADAAFVQIGCLVALATVTAGEDCAGWQTSLSRLRAGGSVRLRRSREPLVVQSSADASEPLVDSAGP